MSQRYPGVPPAPPPPDAIPAAAVILFRDGPEGREVLLVRRGVERRFGGGFHAFPGGRLDPEDRTLAVPGASGDDAAFVACGARELFEETGVLLARGAERVPAAAREAGRRALLGGSLGFAAFLAAHGLALDAARFAPAGRWVTPEYFPLRYDARLFLAPLPAGEAADVWPGELAGGGFVPVRRALARWGRGEILLHPPNLNAVEVLARAGEPSLELLRAPGPRARRIEFQGGFLLCALQAPTLPPATHTNAWIVPAEGGVAVVDPGAPDPGEQERLFGLLDSLAAEGRPPREVWLTHAHADHVGAAAAVARRHGIPIRAHGAARPRIPGLGEGPPCEVAPFREGDLAGGRFRVLETPGHTPEHLAFLDEESGALLCGDLVSTVSTVVIDPPEGDMAEYERQLERMRALAPRTLYPAHGPVAADAPGKLAAYRSHRREREALVLQALRSGGTLAEITARAYLDVPAAVHPVAARSCLAVLGKLEAEGRARRRGARFEPK